MLDLDAYFARIGYAGPRTATLETLRALHALHPAAIPFENFDPLLGRPVSLDTPALQDKLVHRRRGGYCFEHNTLFRAALESLGFTVSGLAGRVLGRTPPHRPRPRTHMALGVAIGGETYLVDVGFGGRLMTAPLRLVSGLAQPMRDGEMRLLEAQGTYTVQAAEAGGWQNLYGFTLEPQLPVDHEVANWFTATHPGSLFRNNLLMERLTPTMRISLFNRKVTRRYTDGRRSETHLADVAALRQLLTGEFDLEPPSGLDAVFERLPGFDRLPAPGK